MGTPPTANFQATPEEAKRTVNGVAAKRLKGGDVGASDSKGNSKGEQRRHNVIVTRSGTAIPAGALSAEKRENANTRVAAAQNCMPASATSTSNAFDKARDRRMQSGTNDATEG